MFPPSNWELSPEELASTPTEAQLLGATHIPTAAQALRVALGGVPSSYIPGEALCPIPTILSEGP